MNSRSSRLGLVATLASMLATTLAAQSRPWAELARRDIEAVHATILAQHPGPVDSLNTYYRLWLDSGYTVALAKADSVKSLAGVIAAVSYYTSGFEDGHLGWLPEFVPRTVSWPGVVLARRDGRYVVHHIEMGLKDAPHEGAEVLSCDGVSMSDRMTREVMPFEGGIRSLEASRVRLAPLLLVSDGNPWRTRPKSCRVLDQGVQRDLTLAWRRVSSEELTRYQTAAVAGVGPTRFEILHPANDVAWVTVPSFAENVDDNKAGLEGLLKSLPSVRDSRLIVFDVRGNHGGNSFWGDQLFGALFGTSYADSLRSAQSARVFVQWRASTENASFIEESTMPRFEKSSSSYQQFADVVSAMRDGVRTGRPLTPAPAGLGASPKGPTPPAFASRVILLTDAWCASACLGFADMVLAVSGVRHAGAETYADAVYIDNRSIRLPSDLGWFGFSMKVYRNRPRGHNQSYVPSLAYSGMTWDTASLQQWLLSVAR